ncbi:MAG TPA: hypothetical protein VGN05_09435 [Parvibaculum sp.]
MKALRRLMRRVERRGVQLARRPFKIFPPARLRKMLEAPDAHLFVGYYDIDPFFGENAVLAHVVTGEDGPAQVGLCDLTSGAFGALATTPCWSWQLGARLQAFDGRNLIFNTMEGDAPVARIVDGGGAQAGEMPFHIFAFDAARRRGATLDFGRLYRHRAGYGYKALAGRKGSGIEAVDRGIGIFDVEHRAFVSSVDTDAAWREATRCGALSEAQADAARYLNHPLFSPGGETLAFILVVDGESARRQSLVVADAATGAVRAAMPVKAFVSHFWWVRPGILSAFVSDEAGEHRGRYMVWDVAAGTVSETGPAWPRVDGHQTNHPADGRWITDTYPDRHGFQYLYALDEGARIPLGRFRSRLGMGADKCDLHPRRSADGSLVAIDTAYERHRRVAVIELDAGGGPMSRRRA